MNGKGVEEMDNELRRLLAEKGIEELPDGAESELLAAIGEALQGAAPLQTRPSRLEFLERLGRWQPVLAGGIAAVLVAGIFIATPSGSSSVGGSRTINQFTQDKSPDAAVAEEESSADAHDDLADKSGATGPDGSRNRPGGAGGGSSDSSRWKKLNGSEDEPATQSQSAKRGDKDASSANSAIQGSSQDASTSSGGGQDGQDPDTPTTSTSVPSDQPPSDDPGSPDAPPEEIPAP